jgi:hypothetical protein
MGIIAKELMDDDWDAVAGDLLLEGKITPKDYLKFRSEAQDFSDDFKVVYREDMDFTGQAPAGYETQIILGVVYSDVEFGIVIEKSEPQSLSADWIARIAGGNNTGPWIIGKDGDPDGLEESIAENLELTDDRVANRIANMLIMDAIEPYITGWLDATLIAKMAANLAELEKTGDST